MGQKRLYRVAVREWVNGKPQRNDVIVVASDPHTALDRAPDHDRADELYDEGIQRAIVDQEIPESRVGRKYSGYIEQAEFVGDLE